MVSGVFRKVENARGLGLFLEKIRGLREWDKLRFAGASLRGVAICNSRKYHTVLPLNKTSGTAVCYECLNYGSVDDPDFIYVEKVPEDDYWD